MSFDKEARGESMTRKKAKNKIYATWLCMIVCTQLFFPQTVSAATKAAIEKAGEAFVSENAKESETETKTRKRTDTEENPDEEGATTASTEAAKSESNDGTSTAEDTNMESESEAEAFTENANEAEATTEDTIRQEIVDFALQFEGNPYVYGGTSLTNGADCSGFVMSVFAEFGYSLPRVAADQYYQSSQKTVENLKPGDLIFYGNGISHVALYIGDGKIIHASTSATGIKISDYDYQTPVGVGTYITEETEGFFGD